MNFLLLHGLAGDPTNWDQTEDILKKEGHNCCKPEINYFKSNFSSIPDISTSIIDNIPTDYLREDTIVVGNSLGGSIALSLGENYSKIILVSSYAKTSTQMISRSITTVTRQINKVFHAPSKIADNQIKKYELLWKRLTSSKENFSKLKRIKKAVSSFDHEQYYQKLHHKLLFICGVNDQISPLDYFEDLRRRYPSIKLFTIQECGHAIPIEKPQELANYIIMGTEGKYA